MSEATVIIAQEPASRVIAVAESPAVVIQAENPVSRIIAASGSGGNWNNFRGIINYDGGRAGTHYGDLPVLDGGGAADGGRNPI
jgi:hypothetical protein